MRSRALKAFGTRRKFTSETGWKVTVPLAIAIAASCAGCLALAVPEVAYEGYKYEHKKQDAHPNTTPRERPSHRRAATGDNSIE